MINYFFKCFYGDNWNYLMIPLCLLLLFFAEVNAQDLTVSAVRYDESRSPNSGTNGIVTSGTTGATIDFDGNHTSSYLMSNPVLEFCYSGNIPQYFTVNGRSATDLFD